MGADVRHQPKELLDSLHIDWGLVVLAFKRDAHLVLPYVLFYQNIDLPNCLAVLALDFGVVSDLCAGCELSLN